MEEFSKSISSLSSWILSREDPLVDKLLLHDLYREPDGTGVAIREAVPTVPGVDRR